MNDQMRLELLSNHNLIAYSIYDGRLIFSDGKVFGVSVQITMDAMKEKMARGRQFAEVEDSTCAIGWMHDEFPEDPLFNDICREADMLRDTVKGRTIEEAIEAWDRMCAGDS